MDSDGKETSPWTWVVWSECEMAPTSVCVSALDPQLVVLFGVRCRNFRRWSFTGGSGALWVSLEVFLCMFICDERQTRKLVT